MAWKLEKKFSVATYIETKFHKAVQTRFGRKFNFNNYRRKSQIFLSYHHLQTNGTVNRRSKKSRNSTSERKFSASFASYSTYSQYYIGMAGPVIPWSFDWQAA